ncbi:hypothetical protein BH11MYX1_BH11MYX1_40190 [soil metagenome]
MRTSRLIFAVVAISQMGATDCGNALDDPGFDVWCGENLCSWKLERGLVVKVPTWNEGDPGVELLLDGTAIEQLSPVDSHDGSCLEFDMIANIEENAQVALNVDVFGDGTIEYTETIPTSRWAPLAFKLPIAGTYRGIRFELTKAGTGRAVLAQIGAKLATDCGSIPAIHPATAPLGAPCPDSGCTDGTCVQTVFGGLCMGCTGSSCSTGETCGAGDPTSPLRELPRTCEPTGSRELGEQCVADGECGSGICNFGFVQPTFEPGGGYGNCSACRTSGAACANGATCVASWPAGGGLHAPFICAAGTAAGASGTPCGANSDCTSGACNGTERKQCDVDGRECATASDCPFDGLHNTACSTVGVQGGRCQ